MMKVLIVDDDAVSRGLLARSLKGTCAVHTAGDGHEALRLFESLAPDLVLLDVMMPDLDGLEVCRRIRAHATLADTPVIFVTAVDSPEGERAGLELGAVDYVTKPLNLALVGLRIRNQLELRLRRNVIEEQNALLARRNEELEALQGRIKHLEGVLPICMYCKSIRAEDDTWQRLERYMSEHTDARFSHGICPDCFRKVEVEFE